MLTTQNNTQDANNSNNKLNLYNTYGQLPSTCDCTNNDWWDAVVVADTVAMGGRGGGASLSTDLFTSMAVSATGVFGFMNVASFVTSASAKVKLKAFFPPFLSCFCLFSNNIFHPF